MVKAATGTLDRLRLEFASRSVLAWTLRIGACMCFVGHGAFGIMTKHAWLPYFAVANIGPGLANRLMPIIGTVDVGMGTLALVSPIPAMGVWMTIWAIWTALLRPLSGESGWEALERAGNYGVPLALLIMLEPWHHVAGFVRPGTPRRLDAQVLRRLKIVLTAAVASLLVGHGMLGLIGKPGHIANYASVLPLNAAVDVTRFAGAFEILLAAVVIVRPSVSLLIFVAAWKLATESLFLTAGASIWEIVERGGSYAAPIALAIVTTLQARTALRRNATEVTRSAELPLDRPPQLDAQVHSSPA
jgi:hypothetical protein